MKAIFIVAILLLTFGSLFADIVHVESEMVFPKKSEIVYDGNVKAFIEEENLTLFSASLVVLKEKNEWQRIKAFSPVIVSTEAIEATAATLLYDLKASAGNLFGEVLAVLKGQDATLTTLNMSFDLKEGRYFSNTPSEIFRKDFRVKGNVFEYLKESSTVIMDGGVRAVKTGKRRVNLSAKKAVMDLGRDFVNAEGSVTLILENATVSAERLGYDLENTGSMKENVEGVIVREGSVTRFKSDVFEFDLDSETYSGNSDEYIEMWRGNTYIRAESFVFRRKEGLITLNGDVYIYDKKRRIKLWASRVVIYMDEDRMKAWKARTEIEVEK